MHSLLRFIEPQLRASNVLVIAMRVPVSAQRTILLSIKLESLLPACQPNHGYLHGVTTLTSRVHEKGINSLDLEKSRYFHAYHCFSSSIVFLLPFFSPLKKTAPGS